MLSRHSSRLEYSEFRLS
jgi:hypothetical protein